MLTHLPPNWIPRLLAVLAAPVAEPQSVRLLTAWAEAEGGSARWNPLNTTLPLYQATNYNSVGVKNYVRPVDGICATAITIANGAYNGILGDLQAGTFTAEQIVRRHPGQFNTWGTGAANVLRVLQTT